jgi:hypothetical protein
MKWQYVRLITVLLGLGTLTYLIVTLKSPIDFTGMWWMANQAKNQSDVGRTSNVKTVPKDILVEVLRQKHHLRPLRETEDGRKIQDLPNGIYGFSRCSELLNTKRGDKLSLEIQKRGDGIAYYVGYASDEDIEKYLARQKNFHILMFSRSRERASSLFEIPVYFVSKCEVRPLRDEEVFDLFVRDIPELVS